MKILVLGSKEYPLGTNKGFDPSPSGGMEEYVQSFVNEISKNNEVIILTRKFPGTKKFEKLKNVEIHRVNFIRGFFFRNPTFNINSFFKSLNMTFDIIVTHDIIGSWFGWLLGKLKRKKVVMVCHGKSSEQTQYNFFLRFIWKILEKVYLLSNKTIFHTKYQAEKFGDHKNFVIIKPGLNKNKLKINKKLKKKFNGKNIVFINRIMKVKGLEYLLKSLSKLDFKYNCLIVGDGPDKETCEKLAKKLKVNVKFFGFREDVNLFYSIADVFVLPSVSESLSYSMLEAMRMKVPTVVTDIGISSKKYSIIVAKENSDDIARGIKEAIGNKTISQNGYEFSKSFDWNLSGKKFNKLFSSLFKF